MGSNNYEKELQKIKDGDNKVPFDNHAMRRQIARRIRNDNVFGGDFGINDNNRAHGTIRGILGECLENGIPRVLPGIVEEGKYGRIGGGGASFNAYPCAIKGDWYPDFLGICFGKEKLTTVFKKAIEHQKPVNDNRSPLYQTPSSITIITDKWDRDTFLSFENQLIECAANNCNIHIILITDYGYYDIFNLSRSDVIYAGSATIPSSWTV